MAIQIIYYNIVIPINNLYKCSGLNNFTDVLKYFTKQNKIKSVWYDDYSLTIGAIMSPVDVEKEIAILNQLGLNTFKKTPSNKYWDDLCVVDFIDGVTLPCSWLEVHNDPYKISYAWMKNKEIGSIVSPEISK